MSNETEKKQIELPTKKEQADNIRQKENEFLDYLGLSRDDLSDDGSDLEQLKDLGGFNDWNNNNNWDYFFNNSNFKSMIIAFLIIGLIIIGVVSYLGIKATNEIIDYHNEN